MNNLLGMLKQISDINRLLEEGEGIDQLIVVVPVSADDAQIAQAKMRACEERGISMEQIDQTVVVKIQEPQLPAEVVADVQVV